MKRPRIEVNLGELDQLLDQAREAPLSEPDCDKIKAALHALVDLPLALRRTTEKTRRSCRRRRKAQRKVRRRRGGAVQTGGVAGDPRLGHLHERPAGDHPVSGRDAVVSHGFQHRQRAERRRPRRKRKRSQPRSRTGTGGRRHRPIRGRRKCR